MRRTDSGVFRGRVGVSDPGSFYVPVRLDHRICHRAVHAAGELAVRGKYRRPCRVQAVRPGSGGGNVPVAALFLARHGRDHDRGRPALSGLSGLSGPVQLLLWFSGGGSGDRRHAETDECKREKAKNARRNGQAAPSCGYRAGCRNTEGVHLPDPHASGRHRASRILHAIPDRVRGSGG